MFAGVGATDPADARVHALVIEPAARLSPNQIERLALAWRDAAGDGAQLVARSNAALAALMVAKSSSRIAAWSAAREATRVPGDGDAQEAAEHAACALVVQDLLTPQQFQLLYGAWAAVLGWPEGSEATPAPSPGRSE